MVRQRRSLAERAEDLAAASPEDALTHSTLLLVSNCGSSVQHSSYHPNVVLKGSGMFKGSLIQGACRSER